MMSKFVFLTVILAVIGLAELRLHGREDDVNRFFILPDPPQEIGQPHFVTERPVGVKAVGMNLVQLATSLNLTRYVKALTDTGIAKTLDHDGPFTLFGPLDIAFERVPKYISKFTDRDLTKFHVARGEYFEKELYNEQLIRSLLSKRDVRINIYNRTTGGRVVTANGQYLNQTDFDAHNGVLHIIDGVMAYVYDRKGTAFTELDNLPLDDMHFNVLSRALKGTGLDEVLNGQGPFTLLAPSDSAFQSLPEKLVDYLVNNRSAMMEVLEFHVTSGTWYELGFETGMQLKSLMKGAEKWQVSSVTDPEEFQISGSRLVSTDFTVSNGVIHVVDKVLLPKKYRYLMEILTSTVYV